jgi:hypothetical protein
MIDSIAYCAGIVDGEGCISIRRFKNSRRNIRYSLHLEVNQTRPEAILLMRSVLGGRVNFVPRNGKYSGRWFWSSDSGHAAEILIKLLPYLTIKLEEAKLAIDFQSKKLVKSGERSFKLGLTQEELEWREQQYQKMKNLKRVHNLLQETYISMAHQLATDANRVNSGNVSEEKIPSQAAPSKGSADGVTTRG